MKHFTSEPDFKGCDGLEGAWKDRDVMGVREDGDIVAGMDSVAGLMDSEFERRCVGGMKLLDCNSDKTLLE